MSKFEKQRGFNIIELMVVLFVASILLTIGVPAFNGVVANSRISTAANDVTTTLHVARTEAIKRRAAVSVCASSSWDADNPACSDTPFEQGWIVFVDAIAPAAPDLAHNGMQDILYAHGPMPEGIALRLADADSLIGNDPFLVFGSNGYPIPALAGNDAVFNFQICDERGNLDAGGGLAAGRWISLTPTGRPQIHREQLQVQSAANPTNGC